MNPFRLQRELNEHLARIGIELPGDGDFDFSSPGAKKIFLSALKTRVAAVRERKAEKAAERQREREADDPLARAYGQSGGEVVDDEPEFLGDDERDDEREPSALDRYFAPRRADEDDADEPDDQRKRSALTRFLEKRKAR